MKTKNNLWALDSKGEIIRPSLYDNIKKKFRADTPMVRSFVPYIVMLVCGFVDVTFFISLCSRITYDDPFMLAVEVSGLMIAYDVAPIYLGIQYKRIQQGLSTKKLYIFLTIGAVIIGLILNIYLRATTISLMSPDLSNQTTQFFGEVEKVAESDTVTARNIALAVFGMLTPLITSLISFVASSIAYNPLLIKKRREEEMIADKTDEIRRVEAILKEYEADTGFEENLKADDDGKYLEMKKLQKAVVIGYCDYVRQRLKEHIGDPTSNNILSEEACIELMNRLDKELESLDKIETDEVKVHVKPEIKYV